MTKKELALATVTDLVSKFLYYDRKEDEELTRADIDELVANDETFFEDVLDAFRRGLDEYAEGERRSR